MQRRIIPLLLAIMLMLSSCCGLTGANDSVASEQGSKVFASIESGIAAEPESAEYDNYETPCNAFVQVIQPTSFADAKVQVEKALKQTPVSLGINVSKMTYSDKINIFNWITETYCAVYDNVQPEFVLPYWTIGMARWNAVEWQLNYSDLTSYNAAGCPEIQMYRLNYSQGWEFANGGGGGAFEEYCDKYLSNINDMSDYEKVVYIADLVCDQCNYDYSALYGTTQDKINANNIENYFTTNKMICQGYSKICQALCIRAGLQCYEVEGQAGGGTHAWNVIIINGKPLYLDVTWYDTGAKFNEIISWEPLPYHTLDNRFAGIINYT